MPIKLVYKIEKSKLMAYIIAESGEQGAGAQRPETRDQRPETRDQRPETRDQSSELKAQGAKRRAGIRRSQSFLIM